MQSEQYQEFADDPEFAKYLIELDPRQVVKYRQTARSKGDENINANKYYAQFNRGIRQTVPVSVIPIGWCDKNQWMLYECCDGITRTEGGKKMTLTDEGWKLLASTYQHEALNYTAEDWEDFSDRANDHNSGEANTDDDMIDGIRRRVANGRLDRIVRKAAQAKGMTAVSLKNNKKEWIDLAAGFFVDSEKGVYRNTRRTKKWFRNRIEEELNKTGKIIHKMNKKSEDWNLKEYANYGGTNYEEKTTAKNTSNGEKVFILGYNKHLTPNIIGNAAHYHANNPKNDITIIMHYQNLADKNDADLEEMRQTAVEYLTKMNKAHNLGITRIVSTPQTEDEVGTKGRDRVAEHWSSMTSNALQYDIKSEAPLYYHPEDDVPNGKSTQQHN
tara:strand:- start:83 stop:1240 length:1158 start_codon:yes stop_codon:yes gene_type:complete